MGTTGQSITLANSIIGVGILAMPFCFQQCGVLLATLILLSMGLVSRLCCYFLLKSALLARRRNFEFLAFHVFGSAGKMAVELGIIGFLMGTCIAYFVVVGDLGPQIIAKMFNIYQSDILRTSIMVIVSLVCVLPLGLLRNVDSLSNVSAATIGFYFCLVIKVLTEAATQMSNVDWDSRVEMWKPQGVLQCVPIFSMALFCQTQLFEIFESMPTLSLEKMNVVTKNAINICTAVYFTLGLFGYIAFCKQDISGNILMSLSPTMANDVIKLGFVMSLAFSFPLIIFPCRASLYSFLYKKVHSSQHDHIINHSIPERTFRCITVGIVAMALFVSLLIPNIELVLGLVGSTIGVLVCVVFPAACFVSVTFKNTNERLLAKVVLVLGLVILVLGTYANLQAAENSHDKYDDKFITQERIDKIVEDFFEAKRHENEGAVIKKPEKDESMQKEEIKNGKVAAIVDSEWQPPNPVPPEAQRIEKNDPLLANTNIAEEKPDKKLKEKPKANNEVDKVSETHPKNLNKASFAKPSLSNGEVKKEEKIETTTKDEVKKMSNQQKIDFIKQAQLAETIKQHGEEQKELIKEQKEILVNILKTKKELRQNNNEAKKIAVESIQKIANMAIQSLNAVSEQPADAIEKMLEPGDTANDAVKKIADVAVEAIKEIKDKPEPAPTINNKNIIVNKIDEIKAAPVQNIDKEDKQKEPVAQKPHASVQNVNDINLANAQALNDVKTQEVKRDTNVVQQVNNLQPEIKTAPIAQSPNANVENQIAKQVNPNNVGEVKLPSVVQNKEHLHLPDEPQSYKAGEDAQKKTDTKENILKTMPLPIAMNENSLKSAEIKHEIVEHPEIHVPDSAKQPINNIESSHNSVPIRQKREILAYTNEASIKTKDKEICKNLDNVKLVDSQEIFPKVDLNDALPNRLPLVEMNMVHHMRSLKSYNENKRR